MNEERRFPMITFINIFHVQPPHQQRVVDVLTQVTADVVSKVPGFLGSTLHRGADGTKVIMFASWRSRADYDAMRHDPASQAALSELSGIARFDPGLFDLVREFEPTDDGTPLTRSAASGE